MIHHEGGVGLVGEVEGYLDQTLVHGMGVYHGMTRAAVLPDLRQTAPNIYAEQVR